MMVSRDLPANLAKRAASKTKLMDVKSGIASGGSVVPLQGGKRERGKTSLDLRQTRLVPMTYARAETSGIFRL